MANTNNLQDIRVGDLSWTGRTQTALRNGGLLDKTLADLEQMKPEELLSVNRLGRGALAEITKHVTQSKSRDREMKLKDEMNRASNSEARQPSKASEPEEGPTQKSATRAITDPIVDFARKHQSMIQGIMDGEMVLVPKT